MSSTGSEAFAAKLEQEFIAQGLILDRARESMVARGSARFAIKTQQLCPFVNVRVKDANRVSRLSSSMKFSGMELVRLISVFCILQLFVDSIIM